MTPDDPWDSSRETAEGGEVADNASFNGSPSEEGTEQGTGTTIHLPIVSQGFDGVLPPVFPLYDGRSEDFIDWTENMEQYLDDRSLFWGYVDGPEEATHDLIEQLTFSGWKRREQEARAIIWNGLTARFRERYRDEIEDLGQSSRSLWNFLHKIYFQQLGRASVGNNFSARAMLLKDFWSVSLNKAEGMDVNAFYARVRSLHAKLVAAGESVPWSQCIVAAHKGLPAEYDGTIASLEARFRALGDEEGADGIDAFEKAFKKSQRYMRLHEKRLAKELVERKAAQQLADQRRAKGLDLTPSERMLFRFRRFFRELKSGKESIFFAGRRWVPASPRGSNTSRGGSGSGSGSGRISSASNWSSPRRVGDAMRYDPAK